MCRNDDKNNEFQPNEFWMFFFRSFVRASQFQLNSRAWNQTRHGTSNTSGNSTNEQKYEKPKVNRISNRWTAEKTREMHARNDKLKKEKKKKLSKLGETW